MIKANKYRNYDKEEAKDKELEDELTAIEKGEDLPVVTAEDQTYKKRYSDLRSYAQRKENDLNEEIKKLKEQKNALESQIKTDAFKLPKSEEEIEAWTQKYPDVSKIVESIAIKKARQASLEVDAKVEDLKKREQKLEAQKAYNQLLAAHEDFEDIIKSEVFGNWISVQPKYIYDALYNNDTDAFSAIRAVDLFKADNDFMKTKGTKTDKEDDTRDAARSVRVPSSKAPGKNTTKEISESWLQGLKKHEYTEEIDKMVSEAMKNGTFVYDITGAAR